MVPIALISCYKVYKDHTVTGSSSPNEGFSTVTSSAPDNAVPDSKWEELLSYAEYLQMTAQERYDFKKSFEDPADFSLWLDAVMELYEQAQKENEIGQDGVIDMDKIDPNA